MNIFKKDKNSLETSERPAEDSKGRPELTPETDIYETKEAITLLMNLPGVEEKSLDISLEDSVLSVVAPQASEEPEGMAPLHKGYETGVFKRVFSIMAEVDKSGIKARLTNGVLRLTLPKAEKAKPQKILVEAG